MKKIIKTMASYFIGYATIFVLCAVAFLHWVDVEIPAVWGIFAFIGGMVVTEFVGFFINNENDEVE